MSGLNGGDGGGNGSGRGAGAGVAAGNRGSRVLPPIVAQLFGLLPAYPGSLLFVTGLNLAIARHMPQDVQQSLTGKRLRIRVRDAGIDFDFAWRGERFVACQKSRANQADGTGAVDTVDLTIAANAHDFVLLAQRQEDPDTLFFSRRLAMEGDTELGLMVKNTLDAIDLPAFDIRQVARARFDSLFKPR